MKDWRIPISTTTTNDDTYHKNIRLIITKKLRSKSTNVQILPLKKTLLEFNSKTKLSTEIKFINIVYYQKRSKIYEFKRKLTENEKAIEIPTYKCTKF